jgi:hypothetical protein
VTTQALLTAIAGGAVLVPLIQYIVAGIKTAAPVNFPNKYWPSVTILVGILLSLAFCGITAGVWSVAAIVGMFAGLGAAGLYTFGKAQELTKLAGAVTYVLNTTASAPPPNVTNNVTSPLDVTPSTAPPLGGEDSPAA